ncbi:hypothetical protein CsSME_00008369 [Camellia sinensis var. sinensis]
MSKMVEIPKLSKPTSTWIKTKLLTRSTIFLKEVRQEDASKRVDLKTFEQKVVLEREGETHDKRGSTLSQTGVYPMFQQPTHRQKRVDPLPVWCLPYFPATPPELHQQVRVDPRKAGTFDKNKREQPNPTSLIQIILLQNQPITTPKVFKT